MPSSSVVEKRVLRTRRRASSPLPPPPPTKRIRRSHPSAPSPPSPPSPSPPPSPLSPPFPTLSDAEVYLDEVKEMFGKYGAEGTSFGEVLLSLVDCSEETRDEIVEFIDRAAESVSLGHIDGSEAPAGQWASWDPAMDSDWERFVSDMRAVGLDDRQVEELSKPSGPREALLCCLWHYPTYSTQRSKFGQTLDKTNKCLAVQCDKIMDHTNVRTHDTYPIRIIYHRQGPQYKKLFGGKTREVMDVCEDFALEAVKLAPFTISLGEHNSELLRERLEDVEGLHVEEYNIRTSFNMYKKVPSCLILRNDEGAIVNMVFFSYHGMFFTHSKGLVDEISFLHDLIWNGVCEWSHVPVARERHFSTFGEIVCRSRNPLHICFSYLNRERITGTITPHEQAIGLLEEYLNKDANPGLMDMVSKLDKTKSVFKAVHEHMRSKGQTTKASAAYKSSEAGQRAQKNMEAGGKKGAETRRSAAWQATPAAQRLRKGIEKGHATQQTPEWRNSEAAQRSRGALKQGHATMSTPEWKASEAGQRKAQGGKKGAETRRTKAWQESNAGQRSREGLEKGLTTRQTSEWINSEAAQRSREALERGRVTQSTAEWKASEAGQRKAQAGKKGAETRRSDEWQNSDAGQRAKEGRRKADEAKARKADAKWALFYHHHVVQTFLQQPADQLDDKETTKRAKIEEAHADRTKRSYFMQWHSIHEDGVTYVEPGVKKIVFELKNDMRRNTDGTLGRPEEAKVKELMKASYEKAKKSKK